MTDQQVRFLNMIQLPGLFEIRDSLLRLEQWGMGDKELLNEVKSRINSFVEGENEPA